MYCAEQNVYNKRYIDKRVQESLKNYLITYQSYILLFWKNQIGFRYGSLVEDFHTGYRLQCEGWISVFCDPPEPQFLGEAPKSLNDVLHQCMRWAIGLYEVMPFVAFTYQSNVPIIYPNSQFQPFNMISIRKCTC